VNPLLTATDVRLILEHTTDKVSSSAAEYDGITNRSLRYAYGRINARGAVEAAQDSLSNGGYTWPERVADVSVLPGQLNWVQNGDPLEFRVEEEGSDVQNDFPQSTDEFLVLESSGAFQFIPVDGACYHAGQAGCSDADVDLADLPASVTVKAFGCTLACGTDVSTCGPGQAQCIDFDAAAGKTFFAIFARSSIGRYSFGVNVDSTGIVADSGSLPPGAGSSGGSQQSTPGPRVTISVSPLEGSSPLTVQFDGNAASEFDIDDSMTVWDFDIDDPTTEDAHERSASHTYEALPGETRVFRVRLTMYDVGPLREGNPGIGETAIRVVGETTDTGGTGGDGDLRIVIGVPGTVGSDVDDGTSPFQVELSLEGTPPGGTPQSVFWDLGDGDTATSLQVTHTYVNETDEALRLPITATLTTVTTGGITISTTASRRITVQPGGAEVENPDVALPGTTPQGGTGSAGSCGVVGLLPLLFTSLSLACMRRRSWFSEHSE
jgi:PKD repeat protein